MAFEQEPSAPVTDPIASLDVRPMQDELQRLIRSHGIDDVSLIVVPSVHDWKHEHGIAETNRERQACLWHLLDGEVVIVILQELRSDHPGRTPLFLHIPWDDYEWVTSDLRRYARYLVLHEIGHGVLGSDDEEAADLWALAELKKIEATRNV